MTGSRSCGRRTRAMTSRWSSSTSTTSSWSTTRTVTPTATWSCVPSRPSCSAVCGRATWWRGPAVRSSASSCPIAPPEPVPRCRPGAVRGEGRRAQLRRPRRRLTAAPAVRGGGRYEIHPLVTAATCPIPAALVDYAPLWAASESGLLSFVGERGSPQRRAVDLSRELWLDRLHGPRVRSLRRLAIAVIGAVAVFIAVAPYASPRAEQERGLYAAVAAVLAANALVLLVAHGWPDWILAAVAIGLPNTVMLILLATTLQSDTLPVLLLWSALASPYFRSRVTALLNLVVVAVGLAVAVHVSPDPRLSLFTWVVTVFACTACTVTVRLIAEHGDAVMLQLNDSAHRDVLTGLLNRRGFDEQLDELWQSGDQAFAVASFDLDHFKEVNDTHGHPAGDHVLRVFGALLDSHMRDRDVVARTGGAEFGMVMPGSGTGFVLERARAVVQAFAAMDIQMGGQVLRCSVSAGVAERGPWHLDPAHLCRDADAALYRAKEAGRNQAVLRRSAPASVRVDATAG